MVAVIPGATTPDEYRFGRPEIFSDVSVGNVVEVEVGDETIGAEVLGVNHETQPEFGTGSFDLRFICNEHGQVRVQMHRDMADGWDAAVAETRIEDGSEYEVLGEVEAIEVVVENRHAGGDGE